VLKQNIRESLDQLDRKYQLLFATYMTRIYQTQGKTKTENKPEIKTKWKRK
jgi:hypothetical protein